MQVRVYRNLTRKCLSVQHNVPGKGWRLLCHVQSATLVNAKFLVYEKGRQRVLREGRKNVHAYVEGELRSVNFPEGARKESEFAHFGIEGERKGVLERVWYNPYKNTTWVDDMKRQITDAPVVYVCTGGVWVHGVEKRIII